MARLRLTYEHVPWAMLISVFIFGLIYYFISIDHFILHGELKNETHPSLVRSMYFSLVTQSLLGYGEITPKSNLARFVVSIQIFISLFVLVGMLSIFSGHMMKHH
jgi:hypothetical protein